MTRVLLICGSGRDGSTNAAVLRTAAACAPDGVQTEWCGVVSHLPLFNPDDDREDAAVDPRVMDLRGAIARADALLLSTPEYAGALPAMLKNLLEWTIGDAGTYDKPVAWINAAGPAAPTGARDAHDSLRRVLAYANARVIEDAVARVPVTRDLIGDDGLLIAGPERDAVCAAIASLAAAVG